MHTHRHAHTNRQRNPYFDLWSHTPNTCPTKRIVTHTHSSQDFVFIQSSEDKLLSPHMHTHANNENNADSHSYSKLVIKGNGMCFWVVKETPYFLPMMRHPGLIGCRPGCVSVQRWQTANVGPTLSMSKHAVTRHSLLSHDQPSKQRTTNHISESNKTTFSILGRS